MNRPPNILLLIGEDTGLHLGCYGDPDARTPILDRLASEGLRATHAFTHSPVCAPSRSGFVTGRYPYSYGAHLMRSHLLDPPPMFTRNLKDAGWLVEWPTKTDFNFEMRPSEFTNRRNWEQEGLPTQGPWLCYTNLNETHESCMWPEEFHDWHHGLQARRKGLPSAQRHDPSGIHIPPYLPDCPEVRGDLARHHDNTSLLDQRIGRILEMLETSGQAENTIVIFMVDHGAGIPRGKRWCYDLGMHLPLIVRWPGRIAPGSVHEGLVGWVDLAPQILRWCGLEPMPNMQGVPFMECTRKYCYGGRDRMDEQYDRIRSVRSSQFLYIRNYRHDLPWAQRNHYLERMPAMTAWRRLHAEGGLSALQRGWFDRNKPAEEFYDCLADPWQLNNLAVDDAWQIDVQAHRDVLDAHLAEVGDMGSLPESDLVSRGIIADQRAEYRCLVAPLSAPLDNFGGPWDIDGSLWVSQSFTVGYRPS